MRRAPLAAGAAMLAAAALVAGLEAWPLRAAAPYFDDFIYLALGRHLDSAWPLVTQDSVGSYFFRPLGMLSWFAEVRLFGTEAPAHYAMTFALHAVNGAALWVLAVRLGLARAPAALAALAFVAHPTAFSGAAWLADRFDVITLGFGLGALAALEHHLVRPSAPRLVFALLAALAAVLSKETGFAIVGVGALLVAWPDGKRHAARRAERIVALIALSLCLLLALALRAVVMREAAQSYLLQQGIAAAVAGGLAKWLAALPRFVIVDKGGILAVAVVSLALAAPVLALMRPAALRALAGTSRLRALALALALAGAVAAVQSPVANLIDVVPHAHASFDFRALGVSRFYYTPICALCLALAVLGDAIVRAPSPRPVTAVLAALALAGIVALTVQSRAVGREWAAHTRAGTLAWLPATVRAISSRATAPGCKIYLLDLPPEALHFRDVADAAVKSALPRGHPALACYVLSESAPWYNLVARAAGHDAAPLEDIRVNGKPYPPLDVGNLTYHYLVIRERPEVIDDPQAAFLAWNGRGYDDVTAQVRERRRAVRFEDRRPPI